MPKILPDINDCWSKYEKTFLPPCLSDTSRRVLHQAFLGGALAWVYINLTMQEIKTVSARHQEFKRQMQILRTLFKTIRAENSKPLGIDPTENNPQQN